MINDKDRRILSETERRLRLEDPVLARSFDTAGSTGMSRRLWTGLTRAATSLPVIVILLLLLAGSLALGLNLVITVLIPLITISIWFWLRRGSES
jgi:hypothetical protein